MRPNQDFAIQANPAIIRQTIQALKANGIETFLVGSPELARDLVLQSVPKGAEVFTISSETLRLCGIDKVINESGNYISIRAQLGTTQDPVSKRKLGASPDYAIGSVQAITHAGHLWIASATGSQLASCVYGAAHMIYVVGAQKIVANDTKALERINEYALPLESLRSQAKYGTDSRVGKLLLIKDDLPGRSTVIIVEENIGY